MEKDIAIEKVRQLTGQLLSDCQAEIVDLTYRRESGGMILRFTVDKTGGINLEDCSSLSRKIEAILDEADVIQEHYTLEVQSPGLDRRLVSTGDFERAMGREIEVGTYGPIAQKREHLGKLIWINEENIKIQTSAEEVMIPRAMIAKAKLYIKF